MTSPRSVPTRRTAPVRVGRRRRTATVTLIALVITLITRAVLEWDADRNDPLSRQHHVPRHVTAEPPDRPNCEWCAVVQCTTDSGLPCDVYECQRLPRWVMLPK